MNRNSLEKNTRLSLLVALGLAVGGPALAAPQETAEAAVKIELPAARTVIDRHLEATNAKEIIETTKCSHSTGKMSMASMGMEGTMEVWAAKPNKNVVIMNMAGVGESKQGFDGSVGWSMNPMMGAQVMKGAELLQAKLGAAYDAPLKPDSLYEKLETVGQEKFEDKDCYKIKLVARPLEGMDPAKTEKIRTTYEYYAVESGLLAGTVATSSSPMGEMEVVTIVSEYKELGKGLAASKTVLKMPMMEMEVSVSTIEYPEEFDAAIFELPKEIKSQLEPAKAKPTEG